MLIIDGVKYEEWTPPSEEEFERVVKEHAPDIFGEESIYFDLKKKLKTRAGIGSIPDGLVIMFGNVPEWHIVEVELSSHDPYAHIVPQVDKFLNGIDNRDTRNKIIEALYDAINGDEFLKLKTRQAIGLDKDVHKFLSDLIARPPTITIVIEEYTSQLREALKKYTQKGVVEFQTFRRVGAERVHAHLFEPLYQVVTPKVPVVSDRGGLTPASTPQDTLEVILGTPSNIKFHTLDVLKIHRHFFPGYKIPFELETDIGIIQTWVTSAPAGTERGDPDKGAYIQANLAEWYRRHPSIKVGDKVVFKAIELMKRYRLEVIK